MAIGSSGYGTLTDQVGDLSSVLERCLGARVLLVNPYSQEARARIKAIADPDYTVELFQDEVRRSIELLKRLKAIGKSVRLKLYTEPPLVKLVILGDYLWLQHYHPDLNIRAMPEYVLQHNLKDHGLYTFSPLLVATFGVAEKYRSTTSRLMNWCIVDRRAGRSRGFHSGRRRSWPKLL